MKPSLDSRIRNAYDRLPAGEQRLADVLLESIGELAAYSATELAGRAGISKATAARLFRRLGYADFTELRQQAREGITWGSPLQALGETSPKTKGNLGVHLAQDIKNLTRTIEGLRSDTVDDSIRLLAGARRIVVVGFRNNYALAHYARGLLVHAKLDVLLLPVGGLTVAEDMAGLTERDVMLALGFRRRLPVLGRLLRTARKAGVRTILLTESGTRDTADVVLRCQNAGASLFDSYVAPLSLLNYLCGGVVLAMGGKGRDRLAAIEALHNDLGDFAAADGI